MLGISYTHCLVSFILFAPLVTISQGNRRRRIITLQHADIPQQFRSRKISDGETFAEQKIGKKVCRLVFASDIYEAVNSDTSLNPLSSHFPAKNIAAMLNETVELQKLEYDHEGTKVQIEVIACGRHDGKILFIENAGDKNNFYVFEKASVSSSDAPPLVRRATKNPEILSNVQSIAECAERNGVRNLPQNNYRRLHRFEYDFQSSYASVDPLLWKNICNINGFKRFELCSLVHSCLNPLSSSFHNMVFQMREEAGTYCEANAILHIPSNDPLGKRGFLPVEVIGCYMNKKLEVGEKPAFYIALDHRKNGSAFLLIDSPLGQLNYLIVIMHLKDVSTLVDLD